MLPLYDHTRRQVCTATFVCLCLLPTLAVTVGGVVRRLPWHKQAEQERLSQELGLNVSLESIEHTSPGVVRYAGVKLGDPETGLELFRCRELVATWTSMTASQGQTRPAIVLAATEARSPSSAWQRLNDVLRRRLECQGGRPETEIRVTADQWTLDSSGQSQILRGVEGGVGLMPNGIQAQLAFKIPGADPAQPLRMRIVRNRQVSPPANGFDMDTGPNSIPCRLLAPCLAEIAALGPDCRFSGNVSINDTPGGWSGNLNGQFSGVDLGRLTGENFAAALTGTATVAIQKATFQHGRIDEITGRIACGPGAVGPGMLAALVTHLRLAPSSQSAAMGQSLAFDRMGLDFWIDQRGISIAGHCSDAAGASLPGAVAVSGSRAVLAEPRSQPQPVAALIQTLAPASEVSIPATRQTGWLARLLPMPDAAKAN